MNKDKLTFNHFNEITNPLLKTYNRSAFTLMLNEEFGGDVAEEYLASFSKGELTAISALLLGIKKYGLEETKRQVMLRVREQGGFGNQQTEEEEVLDA